MREAITGLRTGFTGKRDERADLREDATGLFVQSTNLRAGKPGLRFHRAAMRVLS
jgi:hypothetical protein